MKRTSFFYVYTKRRTVCTLFLCCFQLVFSRTMLSAKRPGLYSSLFEDSAYTAENPCDERDDTAHTADDESDESGNADELSYTLRYKHNLHHGAYITGAFLNGGYTGFLQLESPYPMPYFELTVKNFGMGVYPLFPLQKKYPDKNIPSLFAGAGSLTFGNLLSIVQKPAITFVKPDTPVFAFPKNEFVRVGQSNQGMHYAVSLTGKEWAGAFIASPEKKQQRMQYGLYSGWQRKNLFHTGIRLGVQQFIGFTPRIYQKYDAVVPGSMKYHTIAAIRFLLKHPNIAGDTAGLCSVSTEKQVSGSFTARLHGFYRYAGLHWDSSYVHDHYIAWKGKDEKQQLFMALRPYITVGMFSLHGLYAYQSGMHGYGVSVKLNHSFIRCKGEWIYRTRIHTVNTALSIIGQPEWFTAVRYFEKAGLKTTLKLQEQSLNPLIVKDYMISADTIFGLAEGLSCGLSGSVSQKTVTKKMRKNRISTLVFSYTEPEYGGKAFIMLQKEGIGRTHSGKIECSAKNKPPYFDFSISYTLRK